MSKRQHAASNDSEFDARDVTDPPDATPPEPRSVEATPAAPADGGAGDFSDVSRDAAAGITLDETDGSQRVCVIGGCAIGRAVAATLADTGVPVNLVESQQTTDSLPNVETTTVERFDASALEATQVDEDTILLAVHPNDATNLLFAQLARTTFDATHILARVNDPARLVAYEGLDVETIDVSTIIGRHIVDRL